MFDDTYRTIAAPAEGIYKEKGSRFLAFAIPVVSEQEVKGHLERLRKEYFDARHHCYAYILGPYKDAYRANDDGEPSGTGGKPIHGQLLSLDLTNVLVVVVRYFGGIKLGVSGLINAYRTAARDALDHATIVERTIDRHYRVRFEYPLMNDVMRLLKEYDTPPRNQQFDMDCSLEFSIRQSLSIRIYDAFVQLRGVEIEEITANL
ncbi:MAG: YigZ family protein [Bacteroidales bacterium]|nr:YigZ family protein [Bacteroidales bacterium]